jgi:hypothetical protein
MKQSTIYDKNIWLARCRLEDCQEQKVKCPVCKHPGHVVTHIVNGKAELLVEICITHSHFVENEDAGRNMYCNTQFVYFARKHEIVDRWGLKAESRRRIIDMYAERIRGGKKK